jgi:hypothetical protein
MNKAETECCSDVDSKIIQKTENGKIFRMNNPGRLSVSVCTVDGCLISDTGLKCDFLFKFETDSERIIFLVELKGVAHVHAVRQLVRTAEVLKLREFKGRIRTFIVSSPSPKSATVYQAELKKAFPIFRSIGMEPPVKKNDFVEVTI